MLQVVVVVQSASLVSTAQVGIQGVCHLMLNLVAKPNKEPQIIASLFVNWAPIVVKAPFKFPILVGTVFGAVIHLSGLALSVITVVNSFPAVVRMKQVSPSDHHQHDECFRFKLDLRIVEHADG